VDLGEWAAPRPERTQRPDAVAIEGNPQAPAYPHRVERSSDLNRVVERSSTPVKIFTTTRMDADTLVQFNAFPRIELESDGNVGEINRFLKVEAQSTIERKQLLHGNVPNALKDEICQVLCERSKGMYARLNHR